MSIPEYNAAQSAFYADHDPSEPATDDDEYGVVEWRGSNTAVIESETNPWLSYGFNGNPPIDLTEFFDDERRIILVGGCEQCFEGLMPGVLAAMDSDSGIQRCDTCAIYDGDLTAARALRDEMFPGATVWFNGTN